MEQPALALSTLSTSDMYEAAYYLCRGFTIQHTEILKDTKKVTVSFTFSGANLKNAQIEYAYAQANVNLASFRRAYAHLNYILTSIRKQQRLDAKASKLGAENA